MANITEGKLTTAQQAIAAMAADIASRGDAPGNSHISSIQVGGNHEKNSVIIRSGHARNVGR